MPKTRHRLPLAALVIIGSLMPKTWVSSQQVHAAETKQKAQQNTKQEGLWLNATQFWLPAKFGKKNVQLLTQNMSGKQHHYALKYIKNAQKGLLFESENTSPALVNQWVKEKLTLSTQQGTTGVQKAPAIDQLFATTAPLGVHYHHNVPQISLWSPTATQVNLVQRNGERYAMKPEGKGLWTISGKPSWNRSYYRFEVTNYYPYLNVFKTYTVTDPYSVSLSTNSLWSQCVNLNDNGLQPTHWKTDIGPWQSPEAPEDWVLYELHLRDFSQTDPKVPLKHRGKYTAFSQHGLGMKHLKGLAQNGITHIHLLPIFDIATIPESNAVTAVIPEASSQSSEQQKALGKTREKDGFNWGYDPLHYGVPEGSYSTEPEGTPRILEFRNMVQTLKKNQLGVVMDVVYNHTHAAQDHKQSILDKIVPGYYHRLDPQGNIQNTTCCPDTATEHKMMERLMIDTLVRWARDYQVSGFRFDLMGHHTQQNLKNIRNALNQLTLKKDGVDGKRIYLYGEGWKFGSLNAIAPESAMHQINASGSGIGTFNDRMRDSLRGGNFDHKTRSDQGFINGLFTTPNNNPWNTDTPDGTNAQKAQLLNYTNAVRLGMAGNLKTYLLTDEKGKQKPGSAFAYRGSPPLAYTTDPQENINYVSAHDNYSLWDQIAAKAPVHTTAQTRAKMQLLGLGAVILGQGVPFLHAGSEVLRSKSGDGDSYDSGDWFNALDWTYTDNNWGKGLPPAWRNQKEWDFWRPLLAQPQFKPQPKQIKEHLSQVKALLNIRRSSPLFRLRTAPEIKEQVRFLNAERGAKQIPGLIVMHIADPHHKDKNREAVAVVINATPGPVSFSHPLLTTGKWKEWFTTDKTKSGYTIQVLEKTR